MYSNSVLHVLWILFCSFAKLNPITIYVCAFACCSSTRRLKCVPKPSLDSYSFQRFSNVD